MDRTYLSTDQSMNIALTTNRELTNEIASTKEFTDEFKSKDFTYEQTQAIRLISTNQNLTEKIKKPNFKDSKLDKKFADENHHWVANKKIMDTINKLEKRPKNLRLIKKVTGDNKTRQAFFHIRQ